MEDIGEYEKEFIHDLTNRTDFLHVGKIDIDKFKPEIKDEKNKPMDLDDIMIKQQ